MTNLQDLAAVKVGDLVADDFRRARVFKNHGIEFCCGGGIPLEEACARRGVDLDTVIEALGETDRDPESVPALRAFTSKVARVHGDARPELHGIAERFEELAREMEEHMAFEETDLFPRIRRGEFDAAEALARAEDEHVKAGELMAEIRRLSGDFTPPDWACRTYQASFANLKEFEQDLHVHVHLENNVLFPKLRAAAQA
jgi:regulator of cell morphogenesis and NO signaling